MKITNTYKKKNKNNLKSSKKKIKGGAKHKKLPENKNTPHINIAYKNEFPNIHDHFIIKDKGTRNVDVYSTGRRRPQTFYQENYTRVPKKKIIKQSCEGISNIKQVSERLKQNFSALQYKSPIPGNFKIFPYCNEELRSSVGDYVNKPQIRIPTLDTLKQHFNVKKIDMIPGIKQIPNTNIFESPATNPENFMEALNEFITNNSGNQIPISQTGMFIVSHSEFMTSLVVHLLSQNHFGTSPTLYTNNTNNYKNIAFDNLDILHLQFDKHAEYDYETKKTPVRNMTIRRFLNFYNINIDEDSPSLQYRSTYPAPKVQIIIDKQSINGDNKLLEFNQCDTPHPIIDEDEVLDDEDNKPKPHKFRLEDRFIKKERKEPNIINIFIMRHCTGCHNLQSGTIRKIFSKLSQQEGYINYAMCLKPTLEEIYSRRNHLLALIEKYCYNGAKLPKQKYGKNFYRFEKIVFGSSIIFRAILTSLILFNCLSNGAKFQEEEEEGEVECEEEFDVQNYLLNEIETIKRGDFNYFYLLNGDDIRYNNDDYIEQLINPRFDELSHRHSRLNEIINGLQEGPLKCEYRNEINEIEKKMKELSYKVHIRNFYKDIKETFLDNPQKYKDYLGKDSETIIGNINYILDFFISESSLDKEELITEESQQYQNAIAFIEDKDTITYPDDLIRDLKNKILNKFIDEYKLVNVCYLIAYYVKENLIYIKIEKIPHFPEEDVSNQTNEILQGIVNYLYHLASVQLSKEEFQKVTTDMERSHNLLDQVYIMKNVKLDDANLSPESEAAIKAAADKAVAEAKEEFNAREKAAVAAEAKKAAEPEEGADKVNKWVKEMAEKRKREEAAEAAATKLQAAATKLQAVNRGRRGRRAAAQQAAAERARKESEDAARVDFFARLQAETEQRQAAAQAAAEREEIKKHTIIQKYKAAVAAARADLKRASEHAPADAEIKREVAALKARLKEYRSTNRSMYNKAVAEARAAAEAAAAEAEAAEAAAAEAGVEAARRRRVIEEAEEDDGAGVIPRNARIGGYRKKPRRRTHKKK